MKLYQILLTIILVVIGIGIIAFILLAQIVIGFAPVIGGSVDTLKTVLLMLVGYVVMIGYWIFIIKKITNFGKKKPLPIK